MTELAPPLPPPPSYSAYCHPGPHRGATDDSSADEDEDEDSHDVPPFRQTTAFVVTTDGIRAVPVGGPFFAPPRPAPLLTAAAMQRIGAPLSLAERLALLIRHDLAARPASSTPARPALPTPVSAPPPQPHRSVDDDDDEEDEDDDGYMEITPDSELAHDKCGAVDEGEDDDNEGDEALSRSFSPVMSPALSPAPSPSPRLAVGVHHPQPLRGLSMLPHLALGNDRLLPYHVDVPAPPRAPAPAHWFIFGQQTPHVVCERRTQRAPGGEPGPDHGSVACDETFLVVRPHSGRGGALLPRDARLVVTFAAGSRTAIANAGTDSLIVHLARLRRPAGKGGAIVVDIRRHACTVSRTHPGAATYACPLARDVFSSRGWPVARDPHVFVAFVDGDAGGVSLPMVVEPRRRPATGACANLDALRFASLVTPEALLDAAAHAALEAATTTAAIAAVRPGPQRAFERSTRTRRAMDREERHLGRTEGAR